jgi:mannose-6-phosphate isomerase-like protein (cupin superfamily)
MSSLHPQDWLAQLPTAQGEAFIEAFGHGSLSVELYAPRGQDHQQPHRRDEVYVVVQGQGQFDNGGQLSAFKAGDLLFVPAGRPHRFIDFSNDFVTWVLFYGPEGGEQGGEQP